MKNLLNRSYRNLKGVSLQGIYSYVKAKKVLIFILLPFVVYALFRIYEAKRVNEIYAVDPLIVSYDGNNPPDPMFSVTNMLPGDEVEKIFNVKNDSVNAEDITMDGLKTDELKDFAGILDVEITELPSTTIIYSGKLQNFFDLLPMNIGTFAGGVDKNFKVKTSFPFTAGNEYQGAKVIFNIIWQTIQPSIDLPPECEALEGIVTKVVEGTDGDDNIHATIANELILAKSGNDKVDASSGDDCIVLGDGDDKLKSTSGNDIVLGGNGNDKIDAGSGNDFVYGGSGDDDIESGSGIDNVWGADGDDKIDLGSGNDKAWGELGNDIMDGGNDDDEIYGGDGNDYLRGGSGTDTLFGDSGNDTLIGASGNDFLYGGIDTDNLSGQSGMDTCTDGEVISSCEF